MVEAVDVVVVEDAMVAVKEVVVAVKMKMFGYQLPNWAVLLKKGRSDPSKKSSFSLYQSKKPKSLIIS